MKPDWLDLNSGSTIYYKYETLGKLLDTPLMTKSPILKIKINNRSLISYCGYDN